MSKDELRQIVSECTLTPLFAEKIMIAVEAYTTANQQQCDSDVMFSRSEELWDVHSEYIDDDLFSMEGVAGSCILTEHNYKKLINDLLNKEPNVQECDATDA